MAVVRVDYAALAAVAGEVRDLPQRLAAARQDVLSARSLTPDVGDGAAAASCDELLRQLARLVEMAALTTSGLARSLMAASGDYASAEHVVVRFEG